MLYAETYIDKKGDDILFGRFKADGFRPICLGGSKPTLAETIQEAKKDVAYYESIGHRSFAVVYLQCDFCHGYGMVKHVRKHKRTGRVLRAWSTPCYSCMGADADLQLTGRIA